jgi:3-hydroxybutyryl-CoA dehydrogenase
MKASDIKTIGVLGAGQMGAGIAQVAAAAGYKVQLLDVTRDVAQKARDQIGAVLTRQVEKGKLEAGAREALLANITPTGEVGDLAAAEYVVEAATENLELKLKLLRSVDAVLGPDAILSSNTSSISVTKLAAATRRPAHFMGMHFMNPVPLMKLVELVRAVQTSSETFEATRELATKLGKTVITSNDGPGFLVNRMLVPFLNEACFTLQDGLGSIEDIDQGAKLGLNHPMGPFELADLIGLDTLLSIGEVLHREFADSKYRPPVLLRNLVAAGWYGKKTRRGFYIYDEKGQKIGKSV